MKQTLLATHSGHCIRPRGELCPLNEYGYITVGYAWSHFLDRSVVSMPKGIKVMQGEIVVNTVAYCALPAYERKPYLPC